MPRASRPPALTTDWRRVLWLRLERHHLVRRAPADRLVDVVAEIVGLHAQVMSAAELQAAARVDGLRVADVREALWERRQLVKTWAFRQALHVLAADDLGAFVAAARSLERWHTPAWLRYFALTEAEVVELIEAVGAVLSDRPMTRAGLVDAVTERVGKPRLRDAMLTGWGTFLAPAAQRGRLVFGPSDGRNVAFVEPTAWLDRPVRRADEEDPDAAADALAGLIGRYLTAFPGASREMVARWWAGGRTSGVDRALARLRVPTVEVDVEGTRGIVRAEDVDALAAPVPGRGVRLLPGFDPFTNELPRHAEAVLPERFHDRVHRTAGWVTPIVVVDGLVAGTWELGAGQRAMVSVVRWPMWSRDARRELAEEVERVAAFLDRPLGLEVTRAA
jgi:Winged helix DNA-binding domain